MAEDADLAVEWQIEQDLKCSGCGQPRDESMDPDNARHYIAEDVRCHACAAIGRRADASKKEGVEPEGLLFTIDLKR